MGVARWFVQGLGLAVLAVFLRVLWLQLLFHLPHSPVINHAPGPCHLLPGIEHGSEDIETLPDGKAFITSGLKVRWSLEDPTLQDIKGQIFMFDFTKPEIAPKSLPITGTFNDNNFSPHGLSVRQESGGVVHVYVINHALAGERVEKFQYIPQDGTLHHLKTFSDPAFGYLNDLVVVGEDQFYATVCVYYLHPWLVKMEMMLGFAWGQVIFYDGKHSKDVLDSLTSPNGINYNAATNKLYLVLMGDEQIKEYERSKDNTLALKQTIDVGVGADNIDIDSSTGDLWVGGHPSTREVMEHLQHQRDICGSRVFVLSVKGDKTNSITEVYANTGKQLSGSSVASRHGDAILIGSVRAGLLYCKLIYVGT